MLPPGSTILDVGCGGGIKTRYIAERGYKVKGIDFSKKMIEIAKRESSDVDFEVLDIYDLDKVSQTFDGVFAQAVLLHFPKAEVLKILEKMKDRLNLNGLLYIGVKKIRDDGLEEGVTKENDYGYEYERFFSYYNIEELRTYMEKLNMEILWEGSFFSGRTEWLQLVAKKPDFSKTGSN